MVIAVNEIVKNPSLVSNPKEIIYVEDRRSKKLKSIIIPVKYKEEFEEFLKEKKMKGWLGRNKDLIEYEKDKPNFSEVLEELADWVEFDDTTR